MIRILTVLFLSALALPGLAQTPDKLGPGDAVHITVFQQPDLTTDARVSDSGSISMPLVGHVKVGGQTTNEAANTISEALKSGQFLKNPQVAVALTTLRSRQVSMLGLIVHPGRYPLEESHTRLPDLIAAAGGIGAGGDETVTIIRDGKATKVNSLSKDFELKGGDTIYVNSAPVFYIYGEVMHAGAYPVKSGMTVMQAISLGGGITPRGSENRIKLRRAAANGGSVEFDVNPVTQVMPNDVIVVKEALF
ncbi:MAG TPA: polysaccharide biosynthesis/export family protein [Burkholderiales bacterium]|jgi:polysaccharide export outer membrane protein|nr:polysaccharide biosynthesis/export family protein [Burkholderiales bacterium]